MTARRTALLTSVVLLTFIPIALAQPPAPATTIPTPAPVARASVQTTQPPATRPTVVPVQTPRAPVAQPPTAATPAIAARPEVAARPAIAGKPSDQTPAPVAQAATVPPQASKPVVASASLLRKRALIAVKVEFTITDQLGARAPTKKTMTMTIGAGEFSRIRTTATYAKKVANSNTFSFSEAPLSIDARPEVDGNKIALDFTLEYKLSDDPVVEGAPGGSTSVSERLFAVLESGVPSVIAQSSDAMSDRKVTIEVRATIVK